MCETSGVQRIAAERQRQIDEEGWSQEHDAAHDSGGLALAAACYATPPEARDHQQFLDGAYPRGSTRPAHQPRLWPWAPLEFKKGSRLRDLEKAGALIAAEIDRLLATGNEGMS